MFRLVVITALLSACAAVPRAPEAEPAPPGPVRQLAPMVHGRLPHLQLREIALGASADYVFRGSVPSGSGQIPCATGANVATWQTLASCGIAAGTNRWTLSSNLLSPTSTYDLGLDATGSSTTTPRYAGWTSFPSGTASRFGLDASGTNGAGSGIQLAYGDRMQLYSYHGITIGGGRGTNAELAFVAGSGSSDYSLEVINAGGGALKVDGASNFTGGTITAASVNTTAGTLTTGAINTTAGTLTAGTTNTTAGTLTTGTVNTTAGTLTTGTLVIGSSGAQITASYTGTTSTLPTATAQTCTNLATHITVTSAATGAPCMLGVPSGFAVALNPWCFVDGSGTVQIKFCNPTTGNITPTAGTYTVRVVNP